MFPVTDQIERLSQPNESALTNQPVITWVPGCALRKRRPLFGLRRRKCELPEGMDGHVTKNHCFMSMRQNGEVRSRLLPCVPVQEVLGRATLLLTRLHGAGAQRAAGRAYAHALHTDAITRCSSARGGRRKSWTKPMA